MDQIVARSTNELHVQGGGSVYAMFKYIVGTVEIPGWAKMLNAFFGLMSKTDKKISVMYAIQKENLNQVKHAIGVNELNNELDFWPGIWLTFANSKENIEIMEYLVSTNKYNDRKTLFCPGKDLDKCLVKAASRGSLILTKFFISYGAKIDKKVIKNAKKSKNSQLVKYLEERYQ